MAEIKPLFSSSKILDNQKSDSVVKNHLITENDYLHEFYLSEGYKQVASLFNVIEQGKSYHFVSFGHFSLKHIAFHIIKLIGACEVYSTTYGLGPSSARGLVSAKEKGLISEMYFLYDHKIRTYKEEAHNLCATNFQVKITSIHAKVTVMMNDSWAVVISGSANWSDSNRKIETIDITVDRNLADFHRKWILAAINSTATEPKEIHKQILIANEI